SGGGGAPPTDVGGGAPPAVSNNQTSSAVQNSGGASNPQTNVVQTQTFTPATTVTTQTQTGFTNGLVVANDSTSTTRLLQADRTLPTGVSLTTSSGGSGGNTTQATVIIRNLDGTVSATNPAGATLQLGGNTSNSGFFNDSRYYTHDAYSTNP